VAFALGLFTKQSLLAFPAAVGLHLLMTSRRRLFTWAVAGVAAGAVLLALSFASGGAHFFAHQGLPRIYSYAFFLSNVVWYLLMFQTAIVISLAWCFRNRLGGPAMLLVWAFAAAHLLAFFFSGGAGADFNHMFDPIVALAMIGGVALPYAVRASERVAFRGALLAVLLTVPYYLGVLTMLAPRIQEDAATSRSIPQLENEFRAAAEFVRSQPGPALCENQLVCFAAGKPLEYDAFTVDQQIKTGRVNEAAILKMLDERRFKTIQLALEAGGPIAVAERSRFSRNFMAKLLTTYRPAMQTTSYAFFTPAQ
jgi:hypothetical protein